MQTKKITAMLLTVVLMIGILPIHSFAAATDIVITNHTTGQLYSELYVASGGSLDQITSISVLDGELTTEDWYGLLSVMINSPKITTIDLSGTTSSASMPGGVFNCSSTLTTVSLPSGAYSITNSTFYQCTGLTDITIPEGVTSIGDGAFADCVSLTAITIPASVTSLGEVAFAYCTNLSSITFSDNSELNSIGNSAFLDCTSLTDVTVPAGTTSIGDRTFKGCLGLTDITIPEGVTSIGDEVFSGCTNLSSVTFSGTPSISLIGNYAFSGCTSLAAITIPASVTSIEHNAFNGCTSLSTITMGGGTPISNISSSAFINTPQNAVVYVPAGSEDAWDTSDGMANHMLQKGGRQFRLENLPPLLYNYTADRISDTEVQITIGSDEPGVYYYSIAKAGDPAPTIDTAGPGTPFENSYGFFNAKIRAVDLTEGAYKLYAQAKDSLGNMTLEPCIIDISAYVKPFDMVISNHIAGSLEQEIDDYLDSRGCSGAYKSILSLKVTGGALNAADQDYIYEKLYDYNIWKLDFSETSFEYNVANDNVMMDGLFRDGSAFVTIILPDGISAISDEAFKDCRNLENINIPSSAKSIGDEAFSGCSGLDTVIIPAAVTNIGKYAFQMCSNLASVTILSTEPPTVGEGCFATIAKGAAVYVPKGSASVYKAAGDGDTTDDYWYGLLVDDGTGTDKRVTKVQTINKIVPWGTNKAGIGLPDKVDATLNDGSTMNLDTEWNDGIPAYDGNREGIYFFTGTLKNLPDGIKNDSDKTAEALIMVEALKSAEISPAAFSFDLDAPKDIVSVITWNNASTVTEVVYESGSSQWDIDYTVNGDELTIGKDDILALNPKEGASIPFEISFDRGDSAGFTVDIVKDYQPGADAALSALKLGGSNIEGFDPEIDSYEVELPEGADPSYLAEDVAATPRDPKARVVITPASALPGSTKVEVTAEDGTTTRTYTVNFTITALTYTVTFNKNGGDTEANPGSKTVAAGESLGTLPTAPARSSYTFNGWNTKADGSGTAFTGTTPVTADITVYAKWKVKPTDDGGSHHDHGSSGGGNGTNTTSPAAPTQNTKTEVVAADGSITVVTAVPSVSGQNGRATAAITREQLSSAISQAVAEAAKQGSGSTARVEIKVEAPADAAAVETSIPKAAVDLAADGRIEAFTVSTPVAAITFDSQALDTIAGQATADVKITASKVDTAGLSEAAKAAVGDRPVFSFSVTSGGRTISQFGGNVSVSIPYTPKPGEDTNAIVIYYINAEGKPETVSNCAYDPSTGTISFTTNHFSKYAVGYNKVNFKDVPASAWYSKAVGFIAARGIATGTGNGNYDPEAKLNRGEFMVMLMRAYDIKPDANPKDNFADAGSTYYTGYLAAAKRLGISGGIGSNMFAPDKEITRQEMFTLLYNALKAAGELPAGTSEKKLSGFSDAGQISSWAKEAMTLLVETGTIGGNSGKLSPVSTTTRAEMAQVLYNLLAK